MVAVWGEREAVTNPVNTHPLIVSSQAALSSSSTPGSVFWLLDLQFLGLSQAKDVGCSVKPVISV